MGKRKDNRPPKHLRTLKRGDVREDGMVFLAYTQGYKDGERWVTQESLSQIRKSDRLKDRRRKDNRPPPQLRSLKRGDVRGDGMVFWSYQESSTNGECWIPIGEFKARQKRKYDRRFGSVNARLAENLRSRLRSALKGTSKSEPTLSMLGCTPSELRCYLESQFTEGMSWENYGLHGWHIDHIKPCSSFDLSIDEEQKKCFHYTNLQPLWAEDNLKKRAKFPI